MKNINLHNLVVFIKDEAELQQAREMLEANGEEIKIEFYKFKYKLDAAAYPTYLQKDNFGWFLNTYIFPSTIQITLTELEQKLKEKQDGQSKTVNPRED